MVPKMTRKLKQKHFITATDSLQSQQSLDRGVISSWRVGSAFSLVYPGQGVIALYIPSGYLCVFKLEAVGREAMGTMCQEMN